VAPDSPAGQVFSSWLAAFNAADRDRLQVVFDRFREPLPVDSAIGFRRVTGGFDVSKVLESTPTHLRVWMKERSRPQFAEARVEVEPEPPHFVTTWVLRPIPAPDELGPGG
jgi:hypothetical protein